MKIHRLKILSGVLGGLAVFSLVVPPASASSKDGKRPGGYSSAAAASEVVTSSRESSSPTTVAQSDRKPGPAWKTIGGTVKYIKGNIHTVEDYDGNQIQLYISRETKQLRGNKKVGDPVRAEITRNGFANSVQ